MNCVAVCVLLVLGVWCVQARTVKNNTDPITVNGSTETIPPVTERDIPPGPDGGSTSEPSHNTTTVPPITSSTIPSSSSVAPKTTTTVKPTSSSSPPPTKPTHKPPVTTAIPATTAVPPSNRKFDGPSFFGGYVLASGLMAIGFVAFKFYKARTELNYHTL